jgi:hypothetical protein
MAEAKVRSKAGPYRRRELVPDSAQQFQPLGRCDGPNCSRVATGWVYGRSWGEVLGKYCTRCGTARVEAARHERALLAPAGVGK